MSKVGMLIKFTAKPGQGRTLQTHLSSLKAVTDGEPETEVFVASLSVTEPDVVYLFEVYSSQAGQEAHDANPENIAAKARTAELLGGPPQVMPLAPTMGTGLKP
jgi:quinol monooxygenase YgiN